MNSKNRVLKSTFRFIKRVAASRLGQILFMIHLILLLYVYAERGALVERSVHPYYESVLFNVLILLDLPALIVSSLIAFPVAHESSYLHTYWWSSWVGDAIGLLCASTQWWLIGYFIERFFRRKKFGQGHSN